MNADWYNFSQPHQKNADETKLTKQHHSIADGLVEQDSAEQSTWLNSNDLAQFQRDGYLVIRNLCNERVRSEMLQVIEDSLDPALAPVEYEAEVHYPGSPPSRTAPGGNTPRRLLNAFARDDVFRRWAKSRNVTKHIQNLLQTDQIQLSQNHHNCVMTKFPGYGSETGWHQDIRYWSFDRPELITAWLALGREDRDNGSLTIIPGSHRNSYDRGQFDAALFFRTDLKKNRALTESARIVELNAGDVLFFHCRLIHSAGRNQTNRVKLAIVFTYYSDDNRPIAGTRSAEHPDIDLAAE